MQRAKPICISGDLYIFSTLKVIYLSPLFLQISYLLVPKILLGQKSPKAAIVKQLKINHQFLISVFLAYLIRDSMYLISWIPTEGVWESWLLPFLKPQSSCGFTVLVDFLTTWNSCSILSRLIFLEKSDGELLKFAGPLHQLYSLPFLP